MELVTWLVSIEVIGMCKIINCHWQPCLYHYTLFGDVCVCYQCVCS